MSPSDTTAGIHLRLEPSRPAGDAERGFAAELADPAWMVGRQWQVGEHQGENASSPVRVTATLRHVPIGPIGDRPLLDPRSVPAEAAIETGPDDWWTTGRRIRIGRAVAQAAQAGGVTLPSGHRFTDLAEPYAGLNGRAYDGRELARDPAVRTDPLFTSVLAEVPARPADTWHTDTLDHSALFPCAEGALTAAGHDGGEVDWWTVDAAPPATGPPADPAETVDVLPDRFRVPGSPAARWWQIEDYRVDLGGLPPDRSHFASTLVLDVVLGHCDDWFLLPVPARLGHVLVVEDLHVLDSFGKTWPLPAPLDDWSLFRVHGLDNRRLPIWPVAASPLTGEPVDVVTVGADEDANLVWAVEEMVAARRIDHGRRASAPARTPEDETVGPTPRLRYVPSTDVPKAWYPYTLDIPGPGFRYRQGRLVEITHDGTAHARELPTSSFLLIPDDPLNTPHELAPDRLPPTGIRLDRSAVLARATTGAPVLWMQRRRAPLVSVPASGLRFDAVEPNVPGS
ncbi:hypothetical protein ABZ769_15250 [Streptomyces olivoreticuli]